MSTAESHEYTVQGMTCEHCVRAVREEVSAVPGVSRVDVDLVTERMTVHGHDVDEASVRAAVAEAGYDVAT